jgi:hypothetical protein
MAGRDGGSAQLRAPSAAICGRLHRITPDRPDSVSDCRKHWESVLGITSGLSVMRALHPDPLIMHASATSRLTPKSQIGLLVASDRISNRHTK